MPIETYELTLSGTTAGQFVQNIFAINVNNTGGTNPFVMANDLLEEFNGADHLIQLWCNCNSVNYSLTSARCRRILSAGGPTQIYLQSTLVAIAGERAGNVATSSLAPLFVWLTTTRPTKTGRTFVPSLSESDVDQNVLSAGLLTAMGEFGDLFRDGGSIGGGSDTWTGAVYRRALAAADDVTNYRVSPIVGTQRRRLKPA